MSMCKNGKVNIPGTERKRAVVSSLMDLDP